MRRVVFAVCLLAWNAHSAPTPFEFRPLRIQTNRETLIQLTAPGMQNYRIDTSSNVMQWDSFLTLRSGGLNSHTDSATPFLSQRFYRATQVESNSLTGDHLVTTNGDLVIHPLYHASLLMSWNGKIIYNDPDDEAMFESRYTGMPKGDLILVSHEHGDHYRAPKISAIKNTNVVIIAPPIVYNSLDYVSLRPFTTVLTNGMSTNVFGIQIIAIPAYNTNNNNHLRGVGNGYVVTIGGKRIYFSGDTSNIPEMRALENIDVAFICMNSFTMTPDDAVRAVTAFRPRIVYPYHYGQANVATTNAAYFKSQIGPATGIEVRLRSWY